MIYLGKFEAGTPVFYGANFHNDTGTVEDPTSPEAQLRVPAGTWADLSAPSQQNTKTGHYGGVIDTTGFGTGQHIVRMAGVVSSGKAVATEFSFMIVTGADLVPEVGGDTAVNEDTGGVDNMRVTTLAGVGIDDVMISIYLKTDYDLGNIAEGFIQGQTYTDADGRWAEPVYLDAGFTYTAVFYKQGEYITNTKEFTI